MAADQAVAPPVNQPGENMNAKGVQSGVLGGGGGGMTQKFSATMHQIPCNLVGLMNTACLPVISPVAEKATTVGANILTAAAEPIKVPNVFSKFVSGIAKVLKFLSPFPSR
jgi:hypothetical protein